jgi:hypothetical protein
MNRKIVKVLGFIMAFSLTATSVSASAFAAEEQLPSEEGVLFDAPKEDAAGNELTADLEEEQISEEIIEEESGETAEETAVDTKEAEGETGETEEEPAGVEDGEAAAEPSEDEEYPEEDPQEVSEDEEYGEAEEEIIDEETIEEEELLGEGQTDESDLMPEDEEDLLNAGEGQALSPFVYNLSGDGETYGDLVALRSQTPGAQIFYVLDNRDSTTILNDTNIVWDEEAGCFISKAGNIMEYIDPLVVGADTSSSMYKLHMVAVKKNLLMSEVSNKDLTYAREDEWGDITPEDQYYEFDDDLSMLEEDEYKGLWIPQSQRFDELLVYTGSAVTIDNPRVYYGNRLLEKGRDYTLKYSNNVNTSNAAKVKVTLKGSYSGAETFNFRINKQKLTKDDIKWSVVQVNAKKKDDYWSPQVPDPQITVRSNGKKLKPGKDYQPSYRHDSSGSTYFSDTVNSPGVYSINLATAFGYSNYEFDSVKIVSAVYCIDRDVVTMKECTVSRIVTQKIEDWAYNGYRVEPDFSVKYGKKPLIEGSGGHYTYSFSGNVSVGTATLTITGTDKEVDGIRVCGVKAITFKITGTPINKNNTVITGVDNEYVYSGFEINPGYVLTKDGHTLLEDLDYTVSYSKGGRTNVGTVTMTFKGKGIYSGSLTKTFKIIPPPIEDIEIRNTVSYMEWDDMQEDYTYEKGGVTPGIVATYYGTQLFAGTDYTLTYSNNKAVGDYNKEKNGKRIGPALTIKLKGNYKGTITKHFTITQKDIGNTHMTLNDLPVSLSPNKYTQKVVITDTNGAALTAGVDYDKKVTYTYDEDTEITYRTGSGKNAKIETDYMSKGDEVKSNHIIPVGAAIRVTVTGIKNYGNNISDTFTFTDSSIKNLKFTIRQDSTWYYTGKPVTPGKYDIRVQMKVGKSWVDIPEDEAVRYYDIIEYRNNVKVGNSAVICIKGRNGFGGTTTLKFKILKASQK